MTLIQFKVLGVTMKDFDSTAQRVGNHSFTESKLTNSFNVNMLTENFT